MVANAIAAFQSISESKGREMLKLDEECIQSFLTALDGCSQIGNEWGMINILDAIAKYVSSDQKTIEA